MSDFYNPQRSKNIYNPKDTTPFRLSRSKIELFLQCPRCFYLDRRRGVGQPPSFPFNLNSAVDTLLKKEFDIHRAKQTRHPLLKQYKIEATPFSDPRMDEWRDALRGGITFLHKKTNLYITGGVDDIWRSDGGELHIVDYKSTAKDGDVSLDAPWQIGYKRQVEIYQWLFRQNGFAVSDTAYFVYVNGKTDRAAFDARLEFDVVVLPYLGNDAWVEKTLLDIHKCLRSEKIPKAAQTCDFCKYRAAVRIHEDV